MVAFLPVHFRLPGADLGPYRAFLAFGAVKANQLLHVGAGEDFVQHLDMGCIS